MTQTQILFVICIFQRQMKAHPKLLMRRINRALSLGDRKPSGGLETLVPCMRSLHTEP